MYKLNITLNEPNMDETISLRLGDEPLLKLTVFDHDGTAWPAGYTAVLEIHRTNRDPDTLTDITGIPGDDDNEWFFPLTDMTYVIGDYDAILVLTHAAEATPGLPAELDDVTPIEDSYDSELEYSFLPIPIEVF